MQRIYDPASKSARTNGSGTSFSAVLLLAGLIGLSCSRLDEIPQNEAPDTPEKTSFTLIIKADESQMKGFRAYIQLKGGE